MAEPQKQVRVITQNKKAWHDYFVDEKIEAGVELFGTEVKSLRQGAVNLKDSYCSFKNGDIAVDARAEADVSIEAAHLAQARGIAVGENSVQRLKAPSTGTCSLATCP